MEVVAAPAVSSPAQPKTGGQMNFQPAVASAKRPWARTKNPSPCFSWVIEVKAINQA